LRIGSGAPLYVVRDALGHARVGAHEAVDAMRNREWSVPQELGDRSINASPN
jgi:uncharacterized protein (DUF2461 family)